MLPRLSSHPVLRHSGVRQFAKFGVVGGSSLVLDFVIYNGMLLLGAAPLAALTTAFLLSVANGYFWNSRWTFRDRPTNHRRRIPVFVATNCVGFVISVVVSTSLLILGSRLFGSGAHYSLAQTMRMALFRSIDSRHGFSIVALNVSKILTTAIVVAWNFSAAKWITFRHTAVT